MVPETYTNFFSASANAGAALAGLLFLAVTVGSVRTVGPGAPVERRAVATSSFVALINAFFISLAALSPGTNLGVSTVAIGLVSLLLTALIGRDLARGQQPAASLRRLALVVLSAVLYALQCWRGVQLIVGPDETTPISGLASLVVVVYAIAMLRAWELVGAERHGLLGKLSPLRDVDEPPAHEPAP